VDSDLRTDSEFHSRFQRLHHNKKGRSIIEDIIGDVISDIPIDYVHAVCIGVMKKLLVAWTTTNYGPFKLSSQEIEEIPLFLQECSISIPPEFARNTRSLSDLPHYKAPEHRLHLLYIAAVVFQPYLPNALYKHFMLFHIAIKILAIKNRPPIFKIRRRTSETIRERLCNFLWVIIRLI